MEEEEARTASRSLRRASRNFDNSADADGLGGGESLAVARWETGGFLVESEEGVVGRDAIAASRFLSWWAQNARYRPTMVL